MICILLPVSEHEHRATSLELFPTLTAIQGDDQYLKITRPLTTNPDPHAHHDCTKYLPTAHNVNIYRAPSEIGEEDDDVSSALLSSIPQARVNNLISSQRSPSTILSRPARFHQLNTILYTQKFTVSPSSTSSSTTFHLPCPRVWMPFTSI